MQDPGTISLYHCFLRGGVDGLGILAGGQGWEVWRGVQGRDVWRGGGSGTYELGMETGTRAGGQGAEGLPGRESSYSGRTASAPSKRM